MKSYKKNKKQTSNVSNSKKDFDNLNNQEKKNHNKPLNTGNHIEKKWFPRSK